MWWVRVRRYPVPRPPCPPQYTYGCIPERVSTDLALFLSGSYSTEYQRFGPWQPSRMIQTGSRAADSSRPAGRVYIRKIFNESDSDKSNMTLLQLSTLDLNSFEKEYWVAPGEEYKMPYDLYNFAVFVFVIDPATNSSVPILNLEVSNTRMGDFDMMFKTGTSTSNFTFEPPTPNTSVVVTIPTYTAYATVERNYRAFCLLHLMFMVNWTLTMSMVGFTIVIRKTEEKVEESVALLPITMVLSIPAIRSLYIGTPPYGILLGTHRNCTIPLRKIDTAS